MHSKAELAKALQEMLDTELKPTEVWRALSKALTYGDLRIKRNHNRGGWNITGKGWTYKHPSPASAVIYSRLTGEIILIVKNYYSPREIAIKMLDIVKRS